MLIAFVDDSQDSREEVDDPIFVLAGFVAPEEQWEIFSDEWKLRLPWVSPSPAFKMSELAYRWGPDDEKIKLFYRVIERYVSGGFSCIVPVKDVEAAYTKFPLQLKKLPSVYSLMFSAVLDWVCNPRAQADLGISGKVKFIFDTQMVEETDITDRWNGLFALMPDSTKELLEGMPQFEREEDFMPLQAADFYAWWVRRHWREHPKHGVSLGYPYKWVFPWPSERTIPFFEVSWSEAEITKVLWRATDFLWTADGVVNATFDYIFRASARLAKTRSNDLLAP
jgi:Protein of unknown function (DUF3800)